MTSPRPDPVLRLFGDVVVGAEGGIRLATRKAVLVLAFLATASQGRARRERLCRLVWPDRSESQARNSLRQTLSAIRKPTQAADIELIGADTEHVWLVDPDAVDCCRFEALAASAETDDLIAAAELYRADFLADFPGSEDLDHWLRDSRLRYRALAAGLAERMSMQGPEIEPRTAAACRRLAATILGDEPASEPAHRALIRLELAAGHDNGARRQYEICRAAVAAEFGAEPERETAALIADIAGTGEPAPDAAPPVTEGPIATSASPSPRRVSPGSGFAGDARPSIVVLPFDDLAPDGARDFFADGVVEEITAALSRVGDFFVIARQTAIAFKDKVVPLGEIGAQLGVRYAVEGTVRRGGPMVRLYIHLVDTRTSHQIWSDRFDGPIADVFDLQDDIAVKVAAAISPTVRAAEIMQARAKPPENRQAYDLVLEGMPKLWSQNQHETREAAVLFGRAVELSPEYGRASALLAWCHAHEVVYFWSGNSVASRQAAMDCVDRALPFIENDPTGLVAAGAAVSQAESDQVRARALFDRALEIDPNNAWAWARGGWSDFFAGRYDAAKVAFEHAKKLSPLDPFSFNLDFGLAGVLFAKGRYLEAAALSRDTIAKKPGITWAYRQYATYAAMAGRMDEARAALARYREAYPDVTIMSNILDHPQRHNAHYMELYLQGLRLAGLPEGG